MKRIATKYVAIAHRKTSLTTKWMLPSAFVASAVSGIGLHIAGHGTSHEVWHNWAVAHVLSSLVWLISVACHIKRHRQEKPADPCLICSFPDSDGHGHCADDVCGRGELPCWAMAL